MSFHPAQRAYAAASLGPIPGIVLVALVTTMPRWVKSFAALCRTGHGKTIDCILQ